MNAPGPIQFKWMAWATVASILILSLVPGTSLAKLSWDALLGIDKLGHFLLYGFAAFCFFRARSGGPLFIVTGLLFLGLLLEICQGTMPGGRSFDLLDLLANAGGIIFAWPLSTSSDKLHQCRKDNNCNEEDA